MKAKYFIITIILLLVVLYTIPYTRYLIKYKVFGVSDRVFLLHVGQLNLLIDKVDQERDVDVFGYLFKDMNKYYIASDESMAKIKPLLQASHIALLTNKNNKLIQNVESRCLNRYVLVSGKLDKLLTFNTIKTGSSVKTIERDKEDVLCSIIE